MSAAEPHCPECKIEGIAHVVSKESVERSRTKEPWFIIVHCDGCGHIYGVFAKHTFSQSAATRFVLPKA